MSDEAKILRKFLLASLLITFSKSFLVIFQVKRQFTHQYKNFPSLRVSTAQQSTLPPAYLYSKCKESFRCGNRSSLEFPYSMMEADCGLLMVDKCESENPAIRLGPGGNWYDFLERISETTILIRDPILQDHLDSQPCFLPVGVGNLSLPKSPSISFTVLTPNLTLFVCYDQPDNLVLRQNYFKGYNHKSCNFFAVYYKNREVVFLLLGKVESLKDVHSLNCL
ncbi:hypothetical protein Sango_0036300 [Sesamum angolense]|uniref:Uncharacterized protein n=1 Tax=Sesamum angolense TaxID=2727404 RepID=A0AAE1XDW4_9LAMI|nr:hypothetical protein Sango_0036300 [Sesamum angolense]